MMKENINSFSFRRVGLLIKRDVVENWKASLHSLGLAVAGFLFLMYISVLNSNRELMLYDTGIRILRFNYLEELLPSCISMLTFLAMILTCNAMGHMTTKGERTDFLILPARNIEKFIARYLYVFLLFVAIVSVAFVVADALHLLLFPLLGYGEYREVCDWLLPTLFDAGAWENAVQQGRQESRQCVVLRRHRCMLMLFDLCIDPLPYLRVICLRFHGLLRFHALAGKLDHCLR